MKNDSSPFRNPWAGSRGFTMVELMITLVITTVISGAVYAAYQVQQKSFVVQEQVAETQQNLRAAMVRLLAEIRPALCDPDPTGVAGTRILQATTTRFQFTTDIGGDPVNPNTGDGDTNDANENVTFGLADVDDGNGDGIVDGGGGAATNWSVSAPLRRRDALTDNDFNNINPPPAIAEFIDALEFNYLVDDGTPTGTFTNGSGTATASQTNNPIANPNDILAVQVSLLARGVRPDPDGKFVDRATYRTAAGVVWDPPDDNFRRRFVIVTIQLRNLGL